MKFCLSLISTQNFSLGSQPHQLWRHRVTLGIYRGGAKSTDPTKTHWWPTHPLGNHRPETSLISGLWAICSCATRSRCHFGLPAAQQQQGKGMSYQRHVETIRWGLAWWRLPKCMSAWGEIHSSVIQAVAWSPRVSDLMVSLLLDLHLKDHLGASVRCNHI